MDETKRCPKCGQIKKLDEFFRNKARADGRSPYCRLCQMAAGKESLQQLRLEVLDLLGGPVCVLCGIDDVRVLVIDHVKGGGGVHRKDAGSSYSLYRYVQAHRDEFQVLCFNCNHLQRIENVQSGKAYSERVAAEGPPEKVTSPDRWSRDHDACVDCGTTARTHKGGGRCGACFQLQRSRAKGRKPKQRKKFAPNSDRWSRNFHQCVSCSTTSVPHYGHGLCQNCYMRAFNERNRQIQRLD